MNTVLCIFICALMLSGCVNNEKNDDNPKVEAKYLAIDIEKMREIKQSIDEKKDWKALEP